MVLLACSLGLSCSAEQAEQKKTTPTKEIVVASENAVVASEDEVMTWDESADKSKTDPQETESDQ